MNRRQTDTAVGVLLGVVLIVGGSYSWQAYQRRRAVDGAMGPMMDTSMGSMHGPDPLWLIVGTLLIVAVIGGGYLLVRAELSSEAESHSTATPPTAAVDESTTADAQPSDVDVESSTADTGPEGTESTSTAAAGDPAADESTAEPESINPEAHPQKRVLDLLPEDERRVLEPVIDSPGVTQIELRDRADFSKSKVSQTVSDLESRGLLYRERQGRTYRVYPSDDLQANRQ
ncbi:MAG: MarR family transcriptional regulator [Euryarchaeota archaeon]|nr:MarR family transcriptional regulator [Euryarchaeota archaeon]